MFSSPAHPGRPSVPNGLLQAHSDKLLNSVMSACSCIRPSTLLRRQKVAQLIVMNAWTVATLVVAHGAGTRGSSVSGAVSKAHDMLVVSSCTATFRPTTVIAGLQKTLTNTQIPQACALASARTATSRRDERCATASAPAVTRDHVTDNAERSRRSCSELQSKIAHVSRGKRGLQFTAVQPHL